MLQGRYLKQLTCDHTVSNWLKAMGRTEEANRCNKNEIRNCFGGGKPELLNKLSVKRLQEFQTIVLTSDGIHDFIDIDEIESIIALPCPEIEKCDHIIDSAVAAGSGDDLSIVIIRKNTGGVTNGISYEKKHQSWRRVQNQSK